MVWQSLFFFDLAMRLYVVSSFFFQTETLFHNCFLDKFIPPKIPRPRTDVTVFKALGNNLKKKKFQMSPINFQSRSFVMKDTIDFLILENRNVRNITY